MKPIASKALSVLLASCAFVSSLQAYEVWIGTSCMPANAAVHPETWSRTAALVTGLNINRAPCLPDPGTPCYGETSPSTAQWLTIFGAFASSNGFKPIPRSSFRVPNGDGTYSGVHADTMVEQVIDGFFADAATYGYGIGNIMFYNNATGGVNYPWSVAEVQEMRDYLDSTGHSNVGLIWDARTNSTGDHDWCSNSLVTGVLMEACGDLWFADAGSRQEMLQWLWTDPSVANKKIIFQMPANPDPFGVVNGVTNYMSIRRLLQWLGTDLMGFDFMRSSRVVFLPVTYNGPTMTFYPETASPSSYVNTMSSVTLSLIEQKDLFEGRRAAMPTQADADSVARNTPPALGVIAYQSVPSGTGTATIPFTVNDEQTPAASLAVSGSCSNSSSTLAFAGGGSSRTMTISSLQSGTTTVALSVSDGVLSTTQSITIVTNASGSHTAVATGPIQSGTTWGVTPPSPGDAGFWKTGSFTLNMTGSATQTFNGQCLQIDGGGQLTPGIASANLTLNNLILNGGMISTNNTNGLNVGVGGLIALNSGTLKSGGVNNARDVRFTSGSLVGTGTVNVIGTDTNGSYVEIQAGVNTTGFSGLLNVSSNGILNLGSIPVGNASFGVNLSDTGKYANNSNVTLTSLSFNGVPVASGSYPYSSFTTAQKAFLSGSTGTITVVAQGSAPTCTSISSQTTSEDVPLTVSFTVGSAQFSPGSLVVTAYSSDSALVRPENIVLGDSGASRTATITPEPNASGAVTINLAVSDGWNSTTRAFTLTVNAVNDPPTISAVSNQKTHSASTIAVPVVVGDIETAPSGLTLTATSSNTTLIPLSGIQYSGIDANRVVSITTAAAQTGTATITLTVGDGALSASSAFQVSVSTYHAIQAVAAGTINDPLTWGTAIPILGDSANWQTGTKSISMASGSDTFFGDTFEVQAGGQFAPGQAGAHLYLNNLTLSGGTILTANNSGLTIDLGGQQFALLSGTLKTGIVSSHRGITFQNGSLVGAGTIDIVSSGTGGDCVQFNSTINPVGFSGIFSVHNNGVLNLPQIDPDSASFGVQVSGTGYYQINADVALTSLVLGTDIIPVGTYAFEDFTPYEQGFLVPSDNGGSITVVNTPPSITAISNLSINEDASTGALGFTVSDSGTGAGSLTVSATSSNTALVPNANIVLGGSGSSRTVTATPAANQFGSATITVSVSDGSLTTKSSFILTVVSVNDAPTISNVTNKSTNEDTATSPIAFTVGDVETAAGSLAVTGNSSNTALVPNSNIVFGGSGASRTVTLTPAANQFGTTTITLTVSDGDLIATTSFVLTVISVNDAPTISTVTNKSTNEDTATSPIAFTVGDVETAAGSLTVTGSSSNQTLIPNANVVLGGSGANRTVTLTPAINQFGTTTITLSVSDGSLITTTSFVLTVVSVNDAPTISSVSDLSTNEDTPTGAIAFTVGDVETAAGSLTVTGSSSNQTLIPNANVVLGGSGASRTVTLTPALNQFGTTTITLAVSDGSLVTTTSFVLTVISVNDAPTISTIANKATNEDTPTSPIAFTIGDVETAADLLTLTATSSNTVLVPVANIAISGTAASRTVTLTPAPNQFGTTTITLSVSDGALTSTESFVLTVVSVNDAPTITAIADRYTHPATSVVVPFTIGDVETLAGSLSLSGTSSNTAIVPVSGIQFAGVGANCVANITTAPTQTGTTTITLSVSDGSLVTSSTFKLIVSAYHAIQAVASGAINNSATWGVAVPVAGDTSIWQTGTKSISMAATGTDTFYGDTFEVQTSGTFAPGVPTVTLNLNNLNLNGGTIAMANNVGLLMDLGGNQFTLNSGTLKSGVGASMSVKFLDGIMAGSGTIHVVSSTTGTNGSYVDFQSTMSTVGFSGLFSVHDNGTLRLPPIDSDSATFGVQVSGTGKLTVKNDTALTSLVLGADTIPVGTYAFGDFNATQQGYLVQSGSVGTFTVVNTPPTVSAITNRTIAVNTTTGAISFTVGDSQSSAASLTTSGTSSNTTLVPNANIVLGGSGSSRTVTVTPAATKTGTATITVNVSDGLSTTGVSFVLTVQ